MGPEGFLRLCSAREPNLLRQYGHSTPGLGSRERDDGLSQEELRAMEVPPGQSSPVPIVVRREGTATAYARSESQMVSAISLW